MFVCDDAPLISALKLFRAPQMWSLQGTESRESVAMQALRMDISRLGIAEPKGVALKK